MRHFHGAYILGATWLAIAPGAEAQGLFRRLADRAVQQMQGSKTGTAAVAGQTPKAERSPRSGHYTDNLSEPAGFAATKAAYDKFGEVSCTDCEGGIDFDGKPRFSFDQFSGQYEERARRVGHWPIGHVHRWRGRSGEGSLTVIAEEQVDGFRCRRIQYKLVRGKASAERPGLVCFGLANASSSIENWHEIY